MQVELSKIKKSPNPVRTVQDTGGAEQLVRSIKEQGLLQAVKLRPVGDMFEVVFGNRRVEACRRAGFTHIEAVVEPLDDKTVLIQALVENLQRDDLTDREEGLGYKCLRDKHNLKQREIALIVGKSETRVGECILFVEDKVAQKLHICGVPAAARKAQVVRGVLREDIKAREAVVDRVVRDELTVEQTRQAANEMKREKELKEPIQIDFNALDAPNSLVSKIKAREEKAFWDAHEGGMADEYRRALSRADRILEACWGRVKKFPQSLPAEHIPYIESRTRKLGEKLIRRADALNTKRIKELNNDQE